MDWLERVARAASQGLRYLTGEADTARDSIIRAFEDNFDGLVVIGEDYRVIAASRRAAEMLVGAEGGSITGRQVSGFLPEIMLRTVQETFAAGRINAPTPMALARIGTPPNEEYIVQFVANLSEMSARFGSVPRRIVNLTFWDETERRRREEELAFIGTHDMLTGAVTRAELMRIANASLEGERRRASGLSLLIVELRRLRKINETLGRVYGDMVRKQAVSRIKAAGIESVARLGDNAFALIRYGRMRDEEVRAFCENLIERLTLPYWLNQHRALIGVSIGLTHTEVSGFDPEVLLSHAELALAAASAQPGNTFVAFTTAMDQRFRERQVMDLALRQARLRGELSLHYEPQMAFATGEVIGAEAILRWRHPTLGVIPPETFVPAAEENGEIIDIGRWALQEACRAAADWPSPMRLAIDVSPVQFAFADMVAEVEEALRLAGLPAQQLELEVREAMFLAKPEAVIEALNRLRALGVGIVLDKFGTGYSSLGALGRLPVDKIKVDRSFVEHLPSDPESGAIIRAVMTLSETLDRLVLAEGVDTADQAWMLRMMGCQIGQGLHFGRPRPAAEIAAFLAERRRAG